MKGIEKITAVRLAEILTERGVVSSEVITDALYTQDKDGDPFVQVLVSGGHITEWDLAKLYYDVALAIFETATTSTAAWLYYGDIKQKKVDHINGQKALLGEQKKPAITHYYIDANGRRRGFYDTEASWFSYSSWVAWYFGAADPAVPAAPAAPAP